MSTTKSIKINSNSSLTESKKTTIDDEDELIFRKSSDPEPYQLGNAPECVYSGWNIFIGIFLLFTTIFLASGSVASIVTQCFGLAYICAGLLTSVLILKSTRVIFAILTVFSAITIIMTSLTILGFVYSIEGSMPMPELMLKNPTLEIILGGLLTVHIGLNVFCFFVFLKRSFKSEVAPEHGNIERAKRASAPIKLEKESGEVIVMDYF
ncbi:uncharacterized protein CELE_F59C6.3 [Caenorhabditis elegans]|uniref:Uncharacterized protein n=1 Tax=Caenorhabditis elegans TaxID=6239 RepID=Q93829_CAEEL|nr:Uncharacterized protein CELE_F59C6.3 [Caenorhabditis elegans]CAB01874.2 Uncharacterized protein CELE_F59C6.3 [Caenorhabditis elegans]|eukprot:NP_492754.2 Uncharacterized protein CELE_F59C6.3 [Caenorhabditis elegans]